VQAKCRGRPPSPRRRVARTLGALQTRPVPRREQHPWLWRICLRDRSDPAEHWRQGHPGAFVRYGVLHYRFLAASSRTCRATTTTARRAGSCARPERSASAAGACAPFRAVTAGSRERAGAGHLMRRTRRPRSRSRWSPAPLCRGAVEHRPKRPTRAEKSLRLLALSPAVQRLCRRP
jgi:hypothetical protein